MKRMVLARPAVWLALSLFFSPFLVSPPALQAQARTLTLREMVESAGRIFVGTVVETHGGVDNHGDNVTWTTFRVEQTMAGQTASTITIKQFGGDARGISTRLPHMRYFTRGERLMVMLYPESDLGFTSPIGMGQGVLQVEGNGNIAGLTPAALQGLGPILKKNGIFPASTRSVKRSSFQGLINDILREGSKR